MAIQFLIEKRSGDGNAGERCGSRRNHRSSHIGARILLVNIGMAERALLRADVAGSDSFIWLSRFRRMPVPAGLRPGSETSNRNRESSGENRRTCSANRVVRHAMYERLLYRNKGGRAKCGKKTEQSHCLLLFSHEAAPKLIWLGLCPSVDGLRPK